MKKLYYLIILTVILGLVLTGCLLSNVGQVPTTEQSGISYLVKGEPEPPESADTTDLLAGQTINVGTVSIWNDGVSLYVKYKTTGGWEMTETHLAVVTTEGDFPTNNSGNPKVGHFPYQCFYDETEGEGEWLFVKKPEILKGTCDAEGTDLLTEITYKIPLSEIDEGVEPEDLLYIAAHAVVQMQNNGEIQEETAWGDGDDFLGRNWATYFTYSLVQSREILVITQNSFDQNRADRDMVLNYLDELEYIYVSIDEPSGGLTDQSIFEGYDVVIYLTWSYPIGYINLITVDTLVDYFDSGGALIVSGDDISRVGKLDPAHPYQATDSTYASEWEDITRLEYVNNGGSVEVGIINGYNVTIGSSGHPVVAGIGGATFTYPIDIDTTIFIPDTDATALAGATPTIIPTSYSDLIGGTVIVAFEDSSSGGRIVTIDMAFYNGYNNNFGDEAIPSDIAKTLLDNSIRWVSP